MAVEMARERTTLHFVWLEITGKCQLECRHCYADSGPHRAHGTMTRHDWLRVIDDAADMGVRMLQLIGGEPTLHPDLTVLVEHALERKVAVEIYTNLIKVTPGMWEIFEDSGVSLATSYYSSQSDQHDAITGRHRSHALTLANIHEAVRREIPIRVGVIGIDQGQDLAGAVAEMRALGIADVGVDYLRQVGRGGARQCVDQLCGHCASGKLAVMPSGEVYPCVFSRWLPVGDARRMSLVDIDQEAEATRAGLAVAFAEHQPGSMPPCNPPACPPNFMCNPSRCKPASDGR